MFPVTVKKNKIGSIYLQHPKYFFSTGYSYVNFILVRKVCSQTSKTCENKAARTVRKETLRSLQITFIQIVPCRYARPEITIKLFLLPD